MPRTLLLVLFLAVAPAVSAGPAGDDKQPPRNELAEINVTLKDIAALLRQQVAAQREDLLLKRVGIATTQLAAAQERLKRIESEIRGVTSESVELDARTNRLQSVPLEPGETTEIRNMRLNEAKRGVTTLQERLSALNQERIGAQNDVATLQREAREWQLTLDKMLASSP